MRVRCLPCLVVLAGCSFTDGAASGTHVGDGNADATCRFSSQFDTCSLSGTNDLVLSGTNTYDTDTGTLMMGATPIVVTHVVLAGGAGNVDAILVHDFTMTAGAQLRATGMLPLAIVAFGSASLQAGALVDLTAGGAGARTTCANGAQPGADESGGAGGGGGGGFGAAGGAGGDGNAGGTTGTGGPGGSAAATTPNGPLGGCAGSPGGTGDNSGGAGGFAGGALYIVALQQITLDAGAGINAGGAGGGGGHKSGALSNGDAGGGGGGSGGMIELEAAHVHNSGMLAANGGSGGEASGNGNSGNPGFTGLLSTASVMGGGGNSPTGSDGGAGGAKASPGGGSPSDVEAGGGGGGGGGVGYIVIVSPDAVAGATSPDRT